MPITETTTQLKTSVADLAELALTEDTAFRDGEIAYVASLPAGQRYVQIDRTATAGLVPCRTGQGFWVPFTGNALGGVSDLIVYKPGGVAEDNIFNDWASLYAYVTAKGRGYQSVIIDDTIVSPAVIPPGNYPLIKELQGVLDLGVNVQCHLADGALLPNLGIITYGLTLTCFASSPANTPILLADRTLLIMLGAVLQNDVTATASAVDVTFGPNGPTIALLDGGTLGNPTSPRPPASAEVFVPAGGPGQFVVFAAILSVLNNNSLTGPGTAIFGIVDNSCLLNTPLPLAQPGIATLQVFDLTTGELGAHATFFAEILGNLAASTNMPVGYGVATTLAPVGVRPLRPGLLTFLLVTAGGSGNPADAGKTLTVQIEVNNVPVPGAVVVIPADTGGGGVAVFLGSYNAGSDYIQAVCNSSAPLATTMSNITVTLI